MPEGGQMTSKTNEKTRRGIGPRDVLAIIGLAAILWVLRPFITPLLGGMLQPGQTAVSPSGVIIVTPTLAPNAPAAGQGGQTAVSPASLATAVPDIAVTFTDSDGCQNCGTVVPAPWQVAPAALAKKSAGRSRLHARADMTCRATLQTSL
jgi:hypothetical protein